MIKRGVLYGVVAYTLWGLLPIYWKAVERVPALETLAHRTVWSFMFLVLLLTWKRRWAWLAEARRQRKVWATFLVTSALLGLNWIIYIWAVNAGHIVDTSLGYFINPLVNVLLGMLFLRERLRWGQGLAVALAATGVIYLTLNYGGLPWISLSLALTFGIYGLLRKTASLGPMEGLSLETGLLSLPGLLYLLYREAQGAASFGHSDAAITGLLAFTGVITALPLLWFAHAARRVTLATLGIMQYIAPTLQFLIGVLLYDEPFTQTRLIGFVIIWIALVIYSTEGLWQRRERFNARRHRPSTLRET